MFDVVKAHVCDGTLMFTMMRNVDGCSLDRRITKSRYTQALGLMMVQTGVPYCNTQGGSYGLTSDNQQSSL